MCVWRVLDKILSGPEELRYFPQHVVFELALKCDNIYTIQFTIETMTVVSVLLYPLTAI